VKLKFRLLGGRSRSAPRARAGARGWSRRRSSSATSQKLVLRLALRPAPLTAGLGVAHDARLAVDHAGLEQRLDRQVRRRRVAARLATRRAVLISAPAEIPAGRRPPRQQRGLGVLFWYQRRYVSGVRRTESPAQVDHFHRPHRASRGPAPWRLRRRGQEDAYRELGANRLRVQGMRRQRSRIAAVSGTSLRCSMSTGSRRAWCAGNANQFRPRCSREKPIMPTFRFIG